MPSLPQFLPSIDGDLAYGEAQYWSSTESGTEARYFDLTYDVGQFLNEWKSGNRSNRYFVRLVLR